MPPGESWLGLKQMHQLTSEGDYGLRVKMTDFDGKSYVAFYDQFEVTICYVNKLICYEDKIE